MRTLWKPIALALPLTLSAACSDEEAPPPPPATATATATAVATGAAPVTVLSRIGGTLIAAGDYFVELLPRSGGQLSAVVYDASGAPVTGEAALTATIKTSTGAAKPVELTYLAEVGAYGAELDADVEIVPGPVEVSVTARGQTSRGTLATIAVAPMPSHGGTVLVAGDVAAEVRVEPARSVHAYFVDGSGASVQGELEGTHRVVVLGSDGATHPIDLRWDATAGHHVGSVEGEITFVPGPVELVVEAGAVTHRGRVERVAVFRAPAHEGQVAIVGDYTVELVPGEDTVDAYVVDIEGAPVTAGATFTANIGVNYAPVAMVWNAEAGCYRAARHASVDLSVRPIEVAIVARGRRHRGGAHVTLPAPAAHAQVNVDRRGPPARVEASHGARVEVRAPAPPSVRIEIPRPPTVRVSAGASAGGGTRSGSGGASAGASAGFRLGR